MILTDIGIFRLIDILAADWAFSYGVGFAKFFEIDGLSLRPLSEVKVNLVVRRRSELEDGRERSSHFADESFEGSDLAFCQQFVNLFWRKGSAARVFRNAVIAGSTGETTIVFDNFSAALRAGGFQSGRIAQRNRVGPVAFRPIHNAAGEITDLFHKVFT